MHGPACDGMQLPDPEKQKHIGIGIVMRKAKEVRYFSAFNSNNLIVYLERGEAEETGAQDNV